MGSFVNKYFLLFCELPFRFVHGLLFCAISLIRSHLFMFVFILITLRGVSQKMLL